MKKKTIFIIIGVILGLVLIIFLLTKIPKRQFNSFTFPNIMAVKNYTDNEMSDTITMVALNKMMSYDTMTINIFELKGIYDTPDYEFSGVIMNVPFQDHTYNLFLKNSLSMSSLKNVITHELIHLEQYEKNYLQTINDIGYVWMGDTVKYSDVPYDKRPHEIEAYKEGPKLLKELNNILYKKKNK